MSRVTDIFGSPRKVAISNQWSLLITERQTLQSDMPGTLVHYFPVKHCVDRISLASVGKIAKKKEKYIIEKFQSIKTHSHSPNFLIKIASHSLQRRSRCYRSASSISFNEQRNKKQYFFNEIAALLEFPRHYRSVVSLRTLHDERHFNSSATIIHLP